jgi:hypothetical protein
MYDSRAGVVAVMARASLPSGSSLASAEEEMHVTGDELRHGRGWKMTRVLC